MSPIFSIASRTAEERDEAGAEVNPAPGAIDPASLLEALTPGEMQVARLVLTGMSFREVANRLNRSFSTVDHRLRSIRDKLGARSTARMVVLLPELFSGQRPG